MTRHSFPYIPRGSDGNWLVSLPYGGASIGEVLVYAVSTAPPVDPWDTPIAPAGTLISVATTWIVPVAWIETGGLSFVAPFSSSYAMKMIIRSSITPPASVTDWRCHHWVIDGGPLGPDGTYDTTALVSGATIPPTVPTWTYYGPGDTTPDGLTIPADACAVYCAVGTSGTGSNLSWRLGVPLANQGFVTDNFASPSPPFRVWWDTSTPAGEIVNHQRIDDLATHTVPLLPDQLPP